MEITSSLGLSLSVMADSVSPASFAASTAIVDLPNTAQFAQIMAAPAQPIEPTSTTPAPVAASASSDAPATSYRLGDAILSGMQNVSTDTTSALANINRAMANNEPLHPSALLALQMSLIDVALTHSYTSAVISTLTDDINTLVKLQ